jgi:hypothetical protein
MGVEGSLERANVAGIHFEKLKVLEPSLSRRLHLHNPIDLELYEYWRSKLNDSLARIGEGGVHSQLGRG